jgi:hypothetical protein
MIGHGELWAYRRQNESMGRLFTNWPSAIPIVLKIFWAKQVRFISITIIQKYSEIMFSFSLRWTNYVNLLWLWINSTIAQMILFLIWIYFNKPNIEIRMLKAQWILFWNCLIKSYFYTIRWDKSCLRESRGNLFWKLQRKGNSMPDLLMERKSSRRIPFLEY